MHIGAYFFDVELYLFEFTVLSVEETPTKNGENLTKSLFTKGGANCSARPEPSVRILCLGLWPLHGESPPLD